MPGDQTTWTSATDDAPIRREACSADQGSKSFVDLTKEKATSIFPPILRVPQHNRKLAESRTRAQKLVAGAPSGPAQLCDAERPMIGMRTSSCSKTARISTRRAPRAPTR